MTSIVFESATLADSVRKATQVSPRKSGAAFDKAAGVVLDIYPGEDVECVIKATDTSLYYAEVVSCLEATGEASRWRLPSIALEAVVGSLPASAGKVKFEQVGSKVAVSSGRMKASLLLMLIDYYPDWEMFDATGMTSVSSLGGRIAQVEWAASSTPDPPLGGVYLNGTHAIATDRYRMARTPLTIDIPQPIIVPARTIPGLLRKVGDTEVSLDRGVLNIAPDPYTQIRSAILGGNYPDVERVMRTDWPQMVTVDKTLLADMVKRTLSFAGSERDPVIRTIWGKSEIACMMDNAEIGMLGNVIEVPGQAAHKRCDIWVTPKYMLDALDNAPNKEVTIGYDDENTTGAMYVDGGSGWEAWFQTRNKPKPSVGD